MCNNFPLLVLTLNFGLNPETSLENITINFGGYPCTSINSTIPTSVTCTLADDGTGVPKIVAGNNIVPIVFVTNIGYSKSQPTVTPYS